MIIAAALLPLLGLCREGPRALAPGVVSLVMAAAEPTLIIRTAARVHEEQEDEEEEKLI